MRIVIVILLFVLFNSNTYSQNKISGNIKSSAYVVIQPVDFGLGLRYSLWFPKFGLYGSIAKGNYGFDSNEYYGKHTLGYVKNHYRKSIGMLVYLKSNGNKYNISQNFSIGIAHHSYGEMYFNHPEWIDFDRFNTLSCEIGLGAKIHRYAFGIRIDPLNQEGCLDIGFTF